jgi:RNA polymerase sigma-70 factor (ECF subfamily)
VELSTHLDALISRAQSGDSRAFSALIEPHLRTVYATAMEITKNHEDAEDACQPSMMKAFLHIRQYRGNAKFSTWLTRIAINEALMTVRKSQTEGRYRSDEGGLILTLPTGVQDYPNGSSDPEALCAQVERKTLLWEAIGRLENKGRSAVCMLGLEERGTSETAAVCRLSPSGLRSRFQRALRQLRVMLSDKLANSLPFAAAKCELQE